MAWRRQPYGSIRHPNLARPRPINPVTRRMAAAYQGREACRRRSRSTSSSGEDRLADFIRIKAAAVTNWSDAIAPAITVACFVGYFLVSRAERRAAAQKKLRLFTHLEAGDGRDADVSAIAAAFVAARQVRSHFFVGGRGGLASRRSRLAGQYAATAPTRGPAPTARTSPGVGSASPRR